MKVLHITTEPFSKLGIPKLRHSDALITTNEKLRALVLRTAITAPVWRGESPCFCVQSRSGNWVHISAELY
jgi:hypothetical protein